MTGEVRLGLIILVVADLERSVVFYRDAFGWPLPVHEPVYAEFALPASQRLGLYLREGFAANTGRVPFAVPAGELTGTELYFFTEHIDQSIERLEAAGALKLSDLKARDWGDEAAYFADLDGNLIVVARPGAR